jgi:hypothetical protein
MGTKLNPLWISEVLGYVGGRGYLLPTIAAIGGSACCSPDEVAFTLD